MPQSDSLDRRPPRRLPWMPTFRAQVTDLRAWEAKLRLDQPDSVHRYRVATRRLRSTLSGFRPLFDDRVVDELRTELKTVAAMVSRARDAETVHGRVKALLVEESVDLDSDLPLELDLARTRERISHQLGRLPGELGGNGRGTSTARSTTPSYGGWRASRTFRPGLTGDAECG